MEDRSFANLEEERGIDFSAVGKIGGKSVGLRKGTTGETVPQQSGRLRSQNRRISKIELVLVTAIMERSRVEWGASWVEGRSGWRGGGRKGGRDGAAAVVAPCH